jgi:opacity protein-like surface antigen
MKYVVLTTICCIIIFSAGFSQVDSSKSVERDVAFPIDSSRLKTIEFSLSGGTSIPYLPKDFHDYWKKGWNAGGGIGLTFTPGSTGYGSLLLNADVNRFAFDHTTYRNLLHQSKITTSNNPSWMVDIMLNFRGTFTSLSKFIQPYFLIGVGYLHYSQGDIWVTGDTAYTITGDSKSTISWDAGIGIDFPFTDRFGIFVEGKSLLGVADPTRQYFPLRGGFRYRFTN